VIVVDTGIWIDFLRDIDTAQTAWLDSHLTDPKVGLTDLSLFEVLRGERTDGSVGDLQTVLLAFTIYSTGGVGLATEGAAHYRLLRKRGITIRSAIDCLIATFCIRGGHFLLHNDRDFDPFEKHLGLKVIHPQAER